MTAVAQKTVLTGCLAPIDKGGLEQLIANGKANPKVIKTLKCKTVAEGKFRHANYIRNLAPRTANALQSFVFRFGRVLARFVQETDRSVS